ncbi:unnamed protein product [Haemonchus placei]|uniref:Ubiquitin-like domain-containing protein n=1 Tax=Haemonchus placei TaxID=6290 RepID=A0A0N4VU79_HAEPC|nr:unnamed protein product [Haemonchus placei]
MAKSEEVIEGPVLVLPVDLSLSLLEYLEHDQLSGLKEVYYNIKEVLFEYRGMKRTVQGLFAVKPSSGVVVLEQTVHDFVGGVFHLLLESIDREANDNKDQSILKVYIHDESDIVCLELQASPVAVTSAKVDTVKKTIADTTGFDVLVKDLQYHHEEGSVIYDITNLRLVSGIIMSVL